MKKTWIFIYVLIISACSSGSDTQIPSIIGTWSYVVPNTKCYESLTFNTDNTIKISARDEIINGSYSYSSEANTSNRYFLTFTTISDNQLPDCDGNVDSDANFIYEVYIQFKTQTEIELYAQPIGGSVLLTLSSLPTEPLYNPWSSKSSMPTGRHAPSVASNGSSVYVVGGSNNGYLATFEVYNALEDTWTTKPPMQQARRGHSSHILGNELFVIGGEKPEKEISSVEAYDTSINTWSNKASLSIPRSFHASCMHNGKIYVFGGFTSNGLNNNVTHEVSVSSVEVYDPANNTWTLMSPMDKDNWGMSCVTVNDRIYVIGGANNSARYEVYNPTLDIWESGGELITARQYGFAAAEINEIIYILGGYTDAGDSLSSVEALNTSDSTWQTKTSMLSAKHDIGHATINESIFIIGGRDSNNNPLDTLDKYESFMDQ